MSEDLSKDEAVYLEIYKMNMEYARFHEEMREASTRIILLISGALFAFILTDTPSQSLVPPAAICVILLGLFGVALSATHSAKQEEHYEQASVFYLRLMRGGDTRSEARTEAKNVRDRVRDANRLPFFRHRLRIRTLWMVINLFISLGGFGLLLWAWSQPDAGIAG